MSRTLIIQPDCGFARLAGLLRQLGWEIVDRAASPILPGEPEHALFERGQARMAYRFNPVCHLRLLEPPEGTGEAGLSALPLATPRDLRGWLQGPDERTLLRGLLATTEAPGADLSGPVQALRSHPHATVAEAAERASQCIEAAGRRHREGGNPPGPDEWARRSSMIVERLHRLDRHDHAALAGCYRLELELGLIERLTSGDASRADGRLIRALDLAAALALARVAAARGTGFAVEQRLSWADGGAEVIRLPARDNAFGWPDWLDAFSVALLTDDAPALAVLGTAGCIDACAASFDRVDRFWPLLCGALAALWHRDPAAADLLDDTAMLLGRVSRMDPARAEALIAPLLPVARAIVSLDPDAVATAVSAAFSARRDWLQRASAGKGEPGHPYALALSGLLAEAERRGLGSLPESEDRLAPFHRPGPAADPVLIYPRLAILDAVEAEWLIENEGFARHDRSILTQAGDGRLVARYRAFDAPGIPIGELELELLEQKRDHPFDGTHAPPALDLGELLHRAEVLSSEPSPGPDGQPVYDLAQAVEAMDLALAYLDGMPGGFDPATLHSAIGERILREEPGRFGRERMLVYRNAIARQAGLDERPGGRRADSATTGMAGQHRPDARAATGAPPTEVGTGGDTQERVEALAQALTPLVFPLLQAIALDTDGSAVRELVPRDGDYAAAFVGEAVAAARAHYTAEWPRQLARWAGPSVDPDWRIEAHLAPAGLLRDDNPVSRPFPGGYRQIAEWLDPRRVWVCWRYLPPDADAGIAMNGLVWLDDHWAWFPKPYRLAELLRRH